MHDSIVKRAQRNHTTILQALARISQSRVAELIGVTASTVTAFKDDHLQRLSAVLAACGLKAVPDSEESIDREEVDALWTLVEKRARERRDKPNDSGFGNL